MRRRSSVSGSINNNPGILPVTLHLVDVVLNSHNVLVVSGSSIIYSGSINTSKRVFEHLNKVIEHNVGNLGMGFLCVGQQWLKMRIFRKNALFWAISSGACRALTARNGKVSPGRVVWSAYGTHRKVTQTPFYVTFFPRSHFKGYTYVI